MEQGKSLFGIDFGTTSSAVVKLEISVDGKRRMQKIGDANGRPMASVVALERATGKVYTGRETKIRRYELSKTCEYISSIKSLLSSGKIWSIAGKDWTTVDVAAEIFRRLRQETGDEMTQAVVAVPVGFAAAKRAELRQAAALAGIEVLSFVSEPTAAFLANYGQVKGCQRVAVFDWGGGTLDVSILRHNGGRLEEIATAGMDKAGDDIDLLLAEHLHMEICRQKGVQIPFGDMPPVNRDMLIQRAEEAKIDLCTDEEEVKVRLNQYGALGTVRVKLNYVTLDLVIETLVDRAVATLKKAIDESGLGVANIDCVLMSGGSSNLPILADKIRDLICPGATDEEAARKIIYPESTLWSVGEGAALLRESSGKYCANQDIDLLLADGSRFSLLARGTEVTDYHRTAYFALAEDTEEVRLVFGGSADLRESKSIPVPAYRFLEEKIRVDYGVTQDLVFTLTARSTSRPDTPANRSETWEYDRLKLYYELPGGMA